MKKALSGKGRKSCSMLPYGSYLCLRSSDPSACVRACVSLSSLVGFWACWKRQAEMEQMPWSSDHAYKCQC